MVGMKPSAGTPKERMYSYDERTNSHIGPRGQADRLARPHVDKGGRDLAVVLDAQGAAARRHPGRDFQPIEKTAIGFRDHQQVLVLPRDFQAQKPRPGLGHPHPEHLAGTEMRMSSGTVAQ